LNVENISFNSTVFFTVFVSITIKDAQEAFSLQKGFL